MMLFSLQQWLKPEKQIRKQLKRKCNKLQEKLALGYRRFIHVNLQICDFVYFVKKIKRDYEAEASSMRPFPYHSWWYGTYMVQIWKWCGITNGLYVGVISLWYGLLSHISNPWKNLIVTVFIQHHCYSPWRRADAKRCQLLFAFTIEIWPLSTSLIPIFRVSPLVSTQHLLYVIFDNYSTNAPLRLVGYNHLISNKREWN